MLRHEKKDSNGGELGILESRQYRILTNKKADLGARKVNKERESQRVSERERVPKEELNNKTLSSSRTVVDVVTAAVLYV